MIARIQGKVLKKDESFVIVDVSGVGYKIYVTTEVLSKIKKGKDVSLWTHMVVRENLMDLYGFSEKEGMDFFDKLIGISGIGPKSAIAILDLANVETLRKAISAGDDTYLTKVSGIGNKTAQKILLELKDKLKTEPGDEGLKEEADVIEALRSLGYTLKESREALKKVPSKIEGSDKRIKEALKILGGKNNS